jgi:hypothetical protein
VGLASYDRLVANFDCPCFDGYAGVRWVRIDVQLIVVDDQTTRCTSGAIPGRAMLSKNAFANRSLVTWRLGVT